MKKELNKLRKESELRKGEESEEDTRKDHDDMVPTK
jgi:hypothetical protein